MSFIFFKDLKKEFEIKGLKTLVTTDYEVHNLNILLLMDPYEIEVTALLQATSVKSLL